MLKSVNKHIAEAEVLRRSERERMQLQFRQRLAAMQDQMRAAVDDMHAAHTRAIQVLAEQREAFTKDVQQRWDSMPSMEALASTTDLASLGPAHIEALCAHYKLTAAITSVDPRITADQLMAMPLADMAHTLGMPSFGHCIHLRCALEQLPRGAVLPALKTSSKSGTCTERWSVGQVQVWLARMQGGLQYRHVFAEHHMTGQALLALTTEHMAAFMAIPPRMRMRIALAVQTLRAKTGLPPSELRRAIKADGQEANVAP